jgi:chromosome segregation ATPase
MTFNISIIELIVLFFCAVSLGVVIHFFITSRRNLKKSFFEKDNTSRKVEDWKLKYFNDIEIKDKQIEQLKNRYSEVSENNRINEIEVDELRRQQKRLQSELESVQKNKPAPGQTNYLDQLRDAKFALTEHNEKISQLLENIETLKEKEEKEALLEEENEEMAKELKNLKTLLAQKEAEVEKIKQAGQLTSQMTSMLDNAYSEFNALQEKIQKLESEVYASRMMNLEHEDLKEAYQKTFKDLEDAKTKLQALNLENQQLKLQFNEVEDKLRESNFQRQQFQKRVSYLEELNNDLQLVADANKKLEHQLRRVGELESMLNVLSEERDQLLKRQGDTDA